jgi:hypothetical protein
MAKALLGHVGGVDPRMLAELRRLQRRMRDLESQVLRLQAENDALRAVHDGTLGDIHHEELLTMDVSSSKEPALA